MSKEFGALRGGRGGSLLYGHKVSKTYLSSVVPYIGHELLVFLVPRHATKST